ncbi:MAG: AbrB family transcriptional regulator [Chloroflexi bacterium]|nr:AbrB family transcriptional regulator [Chloroflexota bacterium]
MKDAYLAIQARGTIAIPPEIRRLMRLDVAGAQVHLVLRDDGVAELTPVVPVPTSQAWFWTDRWQRMEQEADADIAAGRMTVVEGLDGLLDHLDDLDQPG